MPVESFDFSKKGVQASADKDIVPYKYQAPATTIDQYFEKDQMVESVSKTRQEKEPLGLLKLLRNFFSFNKSAPVSAVESKSSSSPGPIHFTPTLEKPDHLPLNLQGFKLPKIAETTCQLSDEQIYENLSELSDYTMYRIMMIVLTAQNELARENAQISIDDFEQFQKMQVLQKKVFKEIKEALLKDEKLKGICKTIQNFSALVFVVASVAASLGVTIPLAIAASGVATIVSVGGKSYYSVRSDQDNASLVDLGHKMKVSKDRMNSATERMEESVQDDNNEKILGKLLRDQLRMIQMIIRKK